MCIEKETGSKCQIPPDPKGWKDIVEKQELDNYHVQEIVKAVRNWNNSGDKRTFDALMLYISDQILNVLSSYVGTNHLNDGKDIIFDVHSDLIRAVLDPSSKDGRALCEAFVKRIKFRAIDEIRKEEKKQARYQNYEYNPDDIEDDLKIEQRIMRPDKVIQSANIEHILDNIPDPVKRLAFRFYIDGYPIEGENSISKAVGKTPRTISTWIKETEMLLSTKLGEES